MKGTIEYEMAATSDPTDEEEEAPILVERHDCEDNRSVEEGLEKEQETACSRHWRESPYAVGKVEPTWVDERDRYRRRRRGHFCSGYVCSWLGAKRIGNMAVLRESDCNSVMMIDEEGKRPSRRRLDVVAGPYWPMVLFVTYPLILVVSVFTAFRTLPHVSWVLRLIWTACCSGLCVSLGCVAFRDPGIQRRVRDKPEKDGSGGSSFWMWNDQALTWRARGNLYDPDCGCVIEEFDHTCPWTGTAIGKNNTTSFHSFVNLVMVNIVLDIFLLILSVQSPSDVKRSSP